MKTFINILSTCSYMILINIKSIIKIAFLVGDTFKLKNVNIDTRILVAVIQFIIFYKNNQSAV